MQQTLEFKRSTASIVALLATASVVIGVTAAVAASTSPNVQTNLYAPVASAVQPVALTVAPVRARSDPDNRNEADLAPIAVVDGEAYYKGVETARPPAGQPDSSNWAVALAGTLSVAVGALVYKIKSQKNALALSEVSLLAAEPAQTNSLAAELGRRRALAAGLALACGAVPARRALAADEPPAGMMYDENGELVLAKDYGDKAEFQTVRSADGGASVLVPSNWISKPDGSYADPVTGPVLGNLQMTTMSTDKKSITDLGKPERVDPVKALGLQLGLRADMVAAAVRNVDGVTYYDYDLAPTPEKCGFDLGTACNPAYVLLLSCAVRNGELHTLSLEIDPAQWRRSGQALRDIRKSFTVAA